MRVRRCHGMYFGFVGYSLAVSASVLGFDGPVSVLWTPAANC
jgi:hypothetical protein